MLMDNNHYLMNIVTPINDRIDKIIQCHIHSVNFSPESGGSRNPTSVSAAISMLGMMILKL